MDPTDEQTSAYCQARLRLPPDRLQQILGQISQHARQQASAPKASLLPWFYREVKVADGSSVSLPDTAANQKVFPQPQSQKPGCGFPIMKFVGLFSLTTGCLLTTVTGSYYDAELALFRKLWHFLKPRGILVADRHYSDYGTLAHLWGECVDVVVRMNQFRPKDFRQGLCLGPQDRLVTWRKPRRRPRTIGPVLWLTLPTELTLRMFRVTCSAKGFRTRHLIIVTTLLDPEKYPAQEVAKLYRQRWSVELFFRDLKTLLQKGTPALQEASGDGPEGISHAPDRLQPDPRGHGGNGAQTCRAAGTAQFQRQPGFRAAVQPGPGQSPHEKASRRPGAGTPARPGQRSGAPPPEPQGTAGAQTTPKALPTPDQAAPPIQGNPAPQ